VTLRNRRLARLVRLLQELPGQELFQYQPTGAGACSGSDTHRSCAVGALSAVPAGSRTRRHRGRGCPGRCRGRRCQNRMPRSRPAQRMPSSQPALRNW
jgi:hypothetical protein